MKLAVKTGFYLILAAGLIFGLVGHVSAQKVETIDGVKVVHNPAAGKWGKTPPITLQPVRVIGDVDTEDENVAFNMPSDLAVDAQGRLFVLDSANHRIQVFDREGKFVKSIGRRGQGPGEFNMPSSIALDAAGNLLVVESGPGRLQLIAPDGKILKTLKIPEAGISIARFLSSGHLLSAGGGGIFRMARFGSGGGVEGGEEKKASPVPLAKLFDADGKPVRDVGKRDAFDDPMVMDMANNVFGAIDSTDHMYFVFPYQNKIEKYTSEGKLLWRSDRELPYSMEIKGKGEVERKGGSQGQMMVSVRMPQLTRCATAAAVDAKGRLWVVTMARQLRDNEKVQTSITFENRGGGETSSAKTTGAVDLRTTDAYKLEVFDTDGILLGAIPVEIFVDFIHIAGDRLFLIDKQRGVQIHEFKIKE